MNRKWTLGIIAGAVIILAQCTTLKDIIIREAIKAKLGEELFVRSICAFRIDCDFGQEASFEVGFKDGKKFFRCRCFDPQFRADDERDNYRQVNRNRSAGPDYMPLVAYNSWTYDLLSEPGGQFALTLGEQLNVDDILYSPMLVVLPDSNNILSDSIPVMYLYDDPQNTNDVRALIDTTESQKMFQHTYEEETTIFNGTTTYITNIGSVTVAAGTFESCFYVTDSLTVGMVFAPDVGLIRADSALIPSMELSSYTVNTTTGIAEKESDLQINLYPNPTSGLLRVDYERITSLSPEIEVFDMMGKSILITYLTDHSLNLSSLSPGLYYLKFKVNEQVKLAKIVKSY